ncbi:nucleolin-like isoform X2 [Eupeodes corollae]|uniref:nucleolin-like isoform X2 n=1 Tax=Eupeodes corollae TaxID=290404 RepID=UPI0024928A89|nr:nucleolin-like isoform X2 [Eupeodes corollae]
MLKDKKSKLAVKQKPNKAVKKVAEENPKQKKQQLEKLKKAVAAGAVGAKTGGKKSNGKNKAPKIIEVEPESEDEEEAVETVGEESDDEQMESEAEEAGSDQEEDAESDEEQDDDEEAESDDQDADEDAESDTATEKGEKVKKPFATQTVFISKVPLFTERIDIVKLFAPYSKVHSILFNNKRGFYCTNGVTNIFTSAYVVLDSPEAVEKVLAIPEPTINGKKIFLHKHRERAAPQAKTDAKNTVFVSDLTPKINKFLLRQHFEGCGKIEFVNFIKGVEGKAVVCFKDPKSVSSAMKLDGGSLDGQKIQVLTYAPKPKKRGINKNKPGLRGVQPNSKVIKKTPKKKLNKKPTESK